MRKADFRTRLTAYRNAIAGILGGCYNQYSRGTRYA